MNVRTRFAPSPTGLLHVGGIRTALFAWLVAQKHNGQFILRLEDTDQSREIDGADQHIIDCLKALNLTYDEGPDIGGAYGPYRQSERLEIYKSWAEKLIASGHAYADPYSADELQVFRDEAIAHKKPFKFRDHRPANPPKWDGTQPLRFKSDAKSYTYTDEIFGKIETHPDATDDFILMKSDGFPTYNFAHIVDDAEMKVTHIIRGQEFLASMPNYLNLYEALGLQPPIIATVPPIMNEQGNKKLSKRDGAKDVLDYIREGYLPEALVSFIATLGWNDGTEQETFTVRELIDSFSLDRVQKSGARFDERRLLWTNGHFIRQIPLDDLYDLCKNYWPEQASQYDESYKKQVLALVQERLKYFAELPILTEFFFVDLPLNPALISENKQLKKLSADELRTLLIQAQEALNQTEFNTDDLQLTLNTLLETTGQKPAVLFGLIRVATTQAPASPALAESLAVLGKEVTMRRISQQLEAVA